MSDILVEKTGINFIPGLFIFGWYLCYYDHSLIKTLYKEHFEYNISQSQINNTLEHARQFAYGRIEFANFLRRKENGSFFEENDPLLTQKRSDHERRSYIGLLFKQKKKEGDVIYLGSYQKRALIIDFYKEFIGPSPYFVHGQELPLIEFKKLI